MKIPKPIIRREDVAPALLLAVLYFSLGKICFALGTVHESITMVVFLPEGVSLAFGLIFGPRVAIGVFLGEFALVASTGDPLWFSLWLATSNALQNAFGAWFLRRKGLGLKPMDATAIAWLALTSTTMLQVFSATGGVTAKWLHEGLSLEQAAVAWLYWWLANALAQLLVTPFIISWIAGPDSMWRARSIWEKIMAPALNLLVVVAVGFWLPEVYRNPIILTSAPYPTMTWVVLRLGLRGITVANVTLVGAMVFQTAMGISVFSSPTPGPQDFFFVNVFMFCVTTATMLVTAVFTERLDLVNELKRRVTTDSLTGLHSRQHFFNSMRAEMDRSKRFGHTMSAIVFDIDFFKMVNDTYGHAAGDAALRHVADVCRRCFRSVDKVGRVGGEEFAVMLPEAKGQDAFEAAERLRIALAESPVPQDVTEPFSITLSAGVSEMHEEDETIEDFLARADGALYLSKRSGRNRVSLG